MLFTYRIVSLLGIFCAPSLARGQNIGTFWHISDQHLDPYYTDTAQDPTKVCPSSYGKATIDAGPLGDYRCDSPWELVNSSVHAMKLLKPDVDFIIWTGDDTMHTGEQEKYLGTEKVLEIIGNLTLLLKEVFPNTKIFPALGNHDYHPKSQIPPGGSAILSAIAEMWKEWLTEEAYTSFKREGFYSENFGPQNQHLMVVLNSNFWYDSNKQVDGTGDPAQQFKWMEDTLLTARTNKQKVFVIGHVPPGYFELVANEPKKWFYPAYNERFLSIVRTYSDVIAGMFFGHHHSDTFKIFKDISGNTISSMLLAPGVTPWATTLPGVDNGANNPGIRLIKYDKDSLFLKDYTQYYLDLASANKETQEDTAALWEPEYEAVAKFGMEDITTSSWDKLAKSMRNGCESPTSECPSTFADYHLVNSVSYNTAVCNETCQKFQLCAITEVEYAAYEICFENWGSGGLRTSLNTLALVVAFVAFLCYRF